MPSGVKKYTLLQELGLKNVAIEIYLYLLKHKKATVLDVARGTEISRTNVYNHVEELIEMGLLGQGIEKKKKYLYPETPDNLVKMIRAKEVVAAQAADLLGDDFRKNKYESKIRFGYGPEGFKKFAEEFLDNSKEKLARQIVNFEYLTGYTTKAYMKRHWQQRADKKISLKILAPIKDRSAIKKDTNVVKNIKMLREIRFLPKQLEIGVSLIVHDDTVQFFSPPSEGYIFSFESPAFAQTIKNMFDFIWELSEPFT